jgi:hypothetical protein
MMMPGLIVFTRAPRFPHRTGSAITRSELSGDPAKLARALVTIAGQESPPRRFIAGADAIATGEQKIAELRAQIDAYRELATSLDFDSAG